MAAASPQTTSAFELKGRMATLTVLRLQSNDARHVLVQLDERLAEAPGLFAGMPIVLATAAELEPSADMLAAVVAGLRERGLVPVAGMDLPADALADLGLGQMRNSDGERQAPERDGPESARSAQRPAAGGSRVITQPIRSGQQVYARGGDLVVTAPVSAGAELMADGHIHVYDTLRGRALAGVQGDTNARIFCRTLEAELIAVAGQYLLSEQMDARLRGSPAMAWLEGETLRVETI